MIRRALLAGMLTLTAALAVRVSPALAAPTVAIESPGSGTVTNQTRPVFSGMTTDAIPLDTVVVEISSGGSFVENAQAVPNLAGEWSVQLPEDLEDGKYAAVAEQTETLTGETGVSGTVKFTVDTQPPTVTLNAVSSPTSDSTPSFKGSASDTTQVTVYIFEGTSAGGEVVLGSARDRDRRELDLGRPRARRSRTAPTRRSPNRKARIGNGPGFSQERTFTVHAAKPVVTLNAVSSPTSDSTPSFSGTASEKTGVTVYVFTAGDVGGTVRAEAHATGTGGRLVLGRGEPRAAGRHLHGGRRTGKRLRDRTGLQPGTDVHGAHARNRS